MNSDKLIITATVAPAWVFDPKDIPYMQRKWNQSPEDLADEVQRCRKAGASVAHIHGEKPWPVERWTRLIDLVRRRCDIITQVGLSGRPLEERKQLISGLRPEMTSVSMTHSDERYTRMRANVLHTFEDIRSFLGVCLDLKVKPEFEIHTTGALWNFQHLQKKLVTSPPYLTFLFGWPGGRWSPSTMEEMMHRFQLAPADSVCFSSVNPGGPAAGREDPLRLATMAMMLGHNVRVGTEDYPYIKPGILAKDSAELVGKVACVAKDLGFQIATPDEARSKLGIERPD